VVIKQSSTFKEPDPRPHLNVVFIGHVDAGKSTTCGNILVQTGEVDSRMLEKYEREAKGIQICSL
jgi:peptide chain release factor subunit 3